MFLSANRLPSHALHLAVVPVERPWFEARRPRTEHRAALKRAFDVTASLCVLPVVLLLLGVCAVAIRLDSEGPIFFRQTRTGRGGKRFAMLKLRTMRKDAEAMKAKLLHLNTLRYPDFKIKDDPRITKVGYVLRKTSLDELPQVLNVLRGDMSWVGPRPTSFDSSTYNLWHTARLEAKPGITGLWQVSGRNELQFDDRVRLDIAYCRNRSFWLDMQILLRTVGAVITARGAN